MSAGGDRYKIAAFYEFVHIPQNRLHFLRETVRERMKSADLFGTVILAEEGINSTICGDESEVDRFTDELSGMVRTAIKPKYSYSSDPPFRKVDVKIKPEIVTLKRQVDMALGEGTRVSASEWNSVISDPDVLVLDTRNDYEYKTGTFKHAVNPATEKFSELPEYVSEKLDPDKHKKIAMFCTGGIRCEKFAPYMRSLGFEKVFQLEGGILKYLEVVPVDEQLWNGECYVFDTRVTVDSGLKPGNSNDLSQDE